MANKDDRSIAHVPSGIAGLDAVLQGGFLQGGLYIIQGTPGVGKTILGNQICFDHVAKDARTAARGSSVCARSSPIWCWSIT
jgi:circadian clock protein KaiC